MSGKSFKPEIPKSNTLLFSEDSDEDLFSKSDSAVHSTSAASVEQKPNAGRVKHNLNINVAALLPGAAPKKNKNTSPEKKLTADNKTDTSSVFPDSPVENIDVLSSAVKVI